MGPYSMPGFGYGGAAMLWMGLIGVAVLVGLALLIVWLVRAVK